VVESGRPAGSRARVEAGGARPAHYTIVIEWPVAGQGSQILRLPVTT
jgi:hypothetical protein